VNNPINGVPLTLARYTLVRLKLLLDDNVTRYDFGDFMPSPDDLEHTLIFNYMGFDDQIQHITAYLNATATRSSNYTVITVEYNNSLTEGYNLTADVEVRYRNGTLVSSDNSTAHNDTFIFSSLTNTTDYVVLAEFTHTYWEGETIEKSWFLPGAWTTGESNSFPDFGDMGWTFGGATQIIPIAILLMLGGVFSYASAPLGILLTVLVAGAMVEIGLLSLASGFLALAFSLAVILIIGRRD
jgi:hypothetical protein